MDDKSLLSLSTIRKNRGITLQQIAESTKISVRSLEAIEQGEFRKLPGGIYNTSYIRQYARAIDFDESVILAAYQREFASDNPQPERTGRGGSNHLGGYRPASTPV
jgi:cytoskeletal protein RodZ